MVLILVLSDAAGIYHGTICMVVNWNGCCKDRFKYCLQDCNSWRLAGARTEHISGDFLAGLCGASLHDGSVCVVVGLERLDAAGIGNIKACMIVSCPWSDAARIDHSALCSVVMVNVVLMLQGLTAVLSAGQ